MLTCKLERQFLYEVNYKHSRSGADITVAITVFVVVVPSAVCALTVTKYCFFVTLVSVLSCK